MLKLVKSSQMVFGVGQQHASCFGQVRFSALLLKERYPKLFLVEQLHS